MLASNETLLSRSTWLNFQTKFDDLLPKIMKKRSDVKKGRFSMCDEVLNLNLDKGADAIIFIRGEGKKTDERQDCFQNAGRRHACLFTLNDRDSRRAKRRSALVHRPHLPRRPHDSDRSAAQGIGERLQKATGS